MTRTRIAQAVGGALAAMVIIAACTPAGAKIEVGERTIYLAAIEPKGSTTADKEPFPAEALPGGGGYILKEPDDTGTWVVETYRWMPSEITVVEGEKITLEILGVNGSAHPTTLKGYDLNFEVKRGQLTTVTFTADKVGVFQFVCAAHGPSMTGALVVLPAR